MTTEKDEEQCDPLPLPAVGDESQSEVLWRVSSQILRVMQAELPKQDMPHVEAGKTGSRKGVHARQAVATLGVSLARWLAAVAEPKIPSDEVIDVTFEQLRPLMVATIDSERERLADEAAEAARASS